LNIIDSIAFFTASFVIDLSQGKASAAWEHFTTYFFTKLSTDFVMKSG